MTGDHGTQPENTRWPGEWGSGPGEPGPARKGTGGAWIDGLTARRGPSRHETEVLPIRTTSSRILEAATTVPDHGGLRPWRFAVVRAEVGSGSVMHWWRGCTT